LALNRFLLLRRERGVREEERKSARGGRKRQA